MEGNTVQFGEAQKQDKPEQEKRQVSTISFPYLDLDAAVEVANAMYETRGHGAMESADLAATLGQTISGNFRLKTGTARIFGLTDKEGRDLTKLSELGIKIIEDQTEREARAEAFMTVPLYREIYEKYKGQKLPPPKALEREMEGLGVSSKQTDKARQAFERSARQAGFFAKGEDRLVRPFINNSGVDVPQEEKLKNNSENEKQQEKSGEGAGSGGGGGQYHPLIEGMLKTLPKVGEPWPADERKAWLTMAESIFAMIYSKVSETEPPKNDYVGL